MDYIRGADRSKPNFASLLEDYVPEDCPARFIDAYVEGLDFQKLGFTHAQAAPTGRPSCHPGDLLKLYLYGYFEPHPLQPPARSRGRAQPGADVAVARLASRL